MNVRAGTAATSVSIACVGSVAVPSTRRAVRGTFPSVARLARRAPWLCAPSSRTVCPYREVEPVVAPFIGRPSEPSLEVRGRCDTCPDGAWRSLVARVLWEHEVPGSNPGAPIDLRYLHVLAMALFVGGQLVLAVAVVPGLRGRDREGLRAVARRFGWASLGALGRARGHRARGWPRDYALWDDGTLHVKLALVVLAGVLILWHLRTVAAHWLQGAIFLVSLAIVWLGLALAH